MKTNFDRRTWKRFWSAYRAGGAWAGPATAAWVRDAALILMGEYGVAAPAAGRILADKERQAGRFAEFAESGGPTARVIYCVRGSGTETETDRKMLQMVRNGAHAGQVCAALARAEKQD